MVIVTVTMVSTATMVPVIQDGLAPITYTALKISCAIPTCKSVGREYEGAITNNSAEQETSARVGCVQSGSAVCTKTVLVTTLANRESVRSTRVTVMRNTTTTANTDMPASTVGVFFLSKRLTLIFIWEARVTYVAVRALEAYRCGQGSYHRRKIETDRVLLLDIFPLLAKATCTFSIRNKTNKSLL